jgi:hypothetical protein
MAYRNFNLIKIGAELWESTAMGKQIEETHLERVKNFLELFQPEVEAGELPIIELVLEY